MTRYKIYCKVCGLEHVHDSLTAAEKERKAHTFHTDHAMGMAEV